MGEAGLVTSRTVQIKPIPMPMVMISGSGPAVKPGVPAPALNPIHLKIR